MTSHDFEVDLEAIATAVTKLSELQERNKTYDVADYTPNSGMVADPVVVGGLDSFNTKWDQGLNGMLRDISEAAGRLGKVTGIYADYMAVCDEVMTRARDAAAAISTEPLVKGI